MTRSSRRINKRAAQVAAFFFLTTIFISGCSKREEDIGYDLLPNTGIYAGIVVDSFDVITRTVREDSIRVDSLTRAILGATNDPDFGVTSSSLYFQCLLQSINVDFGSSPMIDSVVLSLAVDKNIPTYGKVTTPMDFAIYKMGEILKRENKYYSNYSPALGGIIGNWNGSINPADTSYFYENGNLRKETGLIRIPLNNMFGESFFNANAYGSNESFLNFLNGIAVVPDVNTLGEKEGGFVPVHLNSSNSKLTVYYSDSLFKDFPITSQSERMMKYEVHSRNGEIENQFNSGVQHFEKVYAQSLGGCRVRIEIPELLDLVKDGQQIIINEALLTITLEDGSVSTTYPAPSRLLLAQPDSSSKNLALIQDFIDLIAPPSDQWIGNSNYGGNLHADGKTYKFHFNRHLQAVLDAKVLLDKDINRGFYLIIPSDNPITPSRAIFNTRNDQNVKNIRVKVTYTKL